MTTLFLCGAGNSEGVRLALTVNQQQRSWDEVVLLDDDAKKHGAALLGVPVIGSLDRLADAKPGSAAVNLVARTTAGRAAVHARIAATGVPFANLIHPGVAAGDCVLGRGVLVYEQAILSPETRLDDGSVVFMRAVVGHEASVAPGCVLAAGAVLNARVTLDEQVYVGSNASVLPEVRIGRAVTVGANTMVAMDVPAGATVVGVPGQILANPIAASQPAAAPTTGESNGALEARLLAVLRQVLGRGDVGPTDSFFDVGGTSLRAIQFVTAVRTATGLDLPLAVLYQLRSVRELVRHAKGDRAATDLVSMAKSRALARRSVAAHFGTAV